jgi:hypothetical protein
MLEAMQQCYPAVEWRSAQTRTRQAWYRGRDKERACVLCDIRCGSVSARARHCQETNALRLERIVILFRSPKPGLISRLICVQERTGTEGGCHDMRGARLTTLDGRLKLVVVGIFVIVIAGTEGE